LVAKMAETLDRLARGRLVVGLGAGGAADKMRSVGITPPSAREKIAALAEATAVMRGLWSEREFTFRGHHYALDQANLMPKPVHRIPIWMGVLGPRGADLAGTMADGWLPYLRYTSWDRLRDCRQRVATAAERAGRDPASVTCVVGVQAHVGELPGAPTNAITGSPQEVADGLHKLLDIGFDGVNLSMLGPEGSDQPARFAEEVRPLMRPGRPARLADGAEQIWARP
jgi:alkanesulfonate monooxygenase SsuD/methylene tetrahydromethanopterin reductase-like flavin-dependent oxidoreductase (luciferase family)